MIQTTFVPIKLLNVIYQTIKNVLISFRDGVRRRLVMDYICLIVHNIYLNNKNNNLRMLNLKKYNLSSIK